MKESRHNSGTSLFLMEMILALLFLSLSSAACIQIFAAARKNRLQAEQWNQIQALTTSVGEILEGTDGTDEQFPPLPPGGIKKNTNLIWYYDRNWQSCSSGEAACEMILETDISSSDTLEIEVNQGDYTVINEVLKILKIEKPVKITQDIHIIGKCIIRRLIDTSIQAQSIILSRHKSEIITSLQIIPILLYSSIIT